MLLLFWFSFVLVFYVYVGYPLLIKVISANRKRVNKDEQFQPFVSILIPAFNEESVIAETLGNKFELDYPKDRYEILVVSDESTDETDEIVSQLALTSPVTLRLFRQMPRQGKTSGLNMIIPEARGEILVFSDANSIFDTTALAKLVRNFADPDVGYVTGKMIYVSADGNIIGDGCNAYMKYENMLRAAETDAGSIVGVDGGIDAMRKSIHETLNPDQLPDFVQPLKVAEKGFRVVYEPDALLKEEALDDPEREYRMRVRVSLRALWGLHDMRALLNPVKYGLFALQLISHKLLRYLAFIPLLLMLVANIALAAQGGVYLLLLLGQLAFYGLAWRGHIKKGSDTGLLVTLCYYFTLLNVTSAHAFFKYLRGEKQVIWKPRVG